MPKDWVIAPPWKGREKLAAELRVSPVVAQVLHNRGIESAGAARRFLQPQLSDIHPPEAMPGAVEAAERIAAAIRDRRKIVLYGDYDVDGITGVSILWHCLRLAGAEVEFYLPNRLEEGYGLNTEAIDSLADGGARLIVTVDCGITAFEPAERARRRGVELVITDHHAPRAEETGRPTWPDALVVHPAAARSGAGEYPNRELSGAGVALKLAWAVAQNFSNAAKVSPQFRDFLVDATGLAALGIVADVVPLTGENRVIAYHGLRGLQHSRLPGIAALIQAARLTGKSLDGEDIGFKIAPRLNAIGRMGHARLAVDMLTRAAPDEAVRIAENLEQQNRARQTLQRRITHEALAMVSAQGQDRDAVRGIVLAAEGWHAGVIGIVASRVVEEFGRPAVLIALEDGIGQGSARSVRHFPLHEVLAYCGGHLLSYGGHAMAAGLRIERDQIDDFRAAFQNRAGQLLTPADLRPKLRIDCEVGLSELVPGLVQELGRLEPFGAENPAPLLATDWLEVVGQPRPVGAGAAHLQLTLADGRQSCKAIGFGQAKQLDPLLDHRRCRVAFRPILNHWQGRTSVEMQVVDIHFPQ